MPVAPRQEHVQQHEEPLGEVLHRLGHRARHVHQAEHDGFGVRLRHPLEAAVADVDRVDVRDDLAAPVEPLGLDASAARLPLRRRPSARLLEPARAAPRSRPASAGAARCAAPCCCCRVRGMLRFDGLPVTVIAGALQIDRGRVLQALLDQVREFEVLEEHVEELFPGQRELERVLAARRRGCPRGRPGRSPPCGRGISSPRTYSLLPGTT